MPRPTRAKQTIYAEAKLDLHTAEALFYVNEALFEATQEIIGFDALEMAKDLCPVLPKATKERKPGELRDSLDSRVRRVKKGVRATMTSNSGYGGFVELGTVNMSPEPYLWPAFQTNAPKIAEALMESLGNFTSKK